MTECYCPDDLEAPSRATRALNPTTHEILRGRWLARAVAALDLMRTTEVYFVRREEDAEVAARRIQIRRIGLQDQ